MSKEKLERSAVISVFMLFIISAHGQDKHTETYNQVWLTMLTKQDSVTNELLDRYPFENG